MNSPQFALTGAAATTRRLTKAATSIAVVSALMAIHVPAIAIDGMSVEAGAGNKTEMVRVGIQWNWERRWLESNGAHLGGYWDASLAQWRANRFQNVPDAHQNITSIGFSPVLRYQNDNLKGFYVEAGIGLHLLSDLYTNNGHVFSTKYQFGDHIGVGYGFQNNLELGISLQHFSNGGLKKPNSGVNFAVVRARYQF